MADYWKSQAKKFCDFCKCWIADNKPSIEFHEKGKRHQENVKTRINDIRKKSTKEFKAKEKLDDDMRKMEEAALRAYQKDIAVNPDYSSTSFEMPELPPPMPKPAVPTPRSGPKQPYKRRKPFRNDPQAERDRDVSFEVKKEETFETRQTDAAVKQEETAVAPHDEKVVKQESTDTRLWYESLSDEGYSYYWNTETNESVWEPPPEGYVSLAEQQAQTLDSEGKTQPSKDASKQSTTEVKREPASSSEDESSDSKEDEDSSDSQKEDESLDSVKKLKPSRQEHKPSEASLSEDDSQPSTSDDVPTARPVMGPMPRVDPYGGWQTIVKVEPKKIDLQLPQREIVDLQVPTLTREPKMTFKEKTVTSLANVNESGSFKKRKLASGHKKNMRQRLEDDC